jgi:plastocyanin
MSVKRETRRVWTGIEPMDPYPEIPMSTVPAAPRRSTLALPIIALALLLAACSGTTASSSAATPSSTTAASSEAASESTAASDAPADGDVTVTVTGFAFTADDADTSGDVPTLTIPAGTSVTFVNEDSAPHTATNGTDGDAAADAAFDIDLGAAGTSGTYTFDEAGEFPVTCTIHPQMNMVIVVE